MLSTLLKTIVRSVAVGALATTAMLQPVHALDVDPGDYTALPAGTNLAILYGQHAQRNATFGNGNKAPGNNKLDSDIGLLRMVHYMDIGGYIVDPQFILPFGKLKAKGDLGPVLGSNSGVGDLLVGATLWFTKPGDKTHFGITPFLSLPTGQYNKNDPLSIGENRYKLILNAGYITPLSEKLILDVIGDVTLFGKNDDIVGGGSAKQKAQYQFQSYLRYQLSGTTDLRGGVSYTTGGKTRINGVDQNNKTETFKFNVGVAHFLSPTQQVLATVGRDTSVENGFRENARLNLRFLQVF